MHLVMPGHFGSCVKDSSHTIRPAMAENPMLHTNLIALFVIEPELWPMEVLHCWNTHFRPFLLM